MVLPTSTLRALLTLSTLAHPILSLPAPISKPASSTAKRDISHHDSELYSTWDEADNWEPHSGWYSYNDGDDDDDDDNDEEYWDVDSWDDDSYDYDYDFEDYNVYDDDESEWNDHEGDWESKYNDDSDDDDDHDGEQTHYYHHDWAQDDDQPSHDYSSTPPAEPVSYSPHQAQALYSGIGTVYTQDGYAGSCGNNNDDTTFIAALGNAWMHHQYRASECGRRIQVTNKGSHYRVGGEGNTITVTIQDTCASCGAGHVDFSHAAWDALTDGSPHGQVDLEWTWL